VGTARDVEPVGLRRNTAFMPLRIQTEKDPPKLLELAALIALFVRELIPIVAKRVMFVQ